jgi:hypothetical protein
LEVRLSVDRIYGNGDDIVLGTVSQVEGNLESGNLMRFIGPIQLGDSIPEGDYYLMAKIDSNDSVDEYDEANNIVISEDRDVQITRLPALRIYNPDASVVLEGSSNARNDGIKNYLDPRESGTVAFDLDEGLFYYTESAMRLRFGVQNIGLARVEGYTAWTIQVNLVGALRHVLIDAFAADEVILAFDKSIELGSFTIQELMKGRSEAKPTGDVIDIDIDLALPSGVRLNQAIEKGSVLTEYLWVVEVILDSTDVVRESEIIREEPAFVGPSGLPWWIFNPFEAFTSDMSATNTDQDDGLFGISFQPSTIEAAEWETLYPGFSTSVPGNLKAYAFNRNPVDVEGGQFPGTSGITKIEGDDYFRVAFDFVTRAEDLIYWVEAADALPITPTAPGYEVLTAIAGPYNASTGVASLTGDGGLIDEGNVTSVLDQGYTARVTVKDSQKVSVSAMRVFQVRIEVVPGAVESYVIAEMAALGETDPSKNRASDDADSDGKSNLVELALGFNPTDNGDIPSTTDLEDAVLTEMITAIGSADPVPADIDLGDDYDLDGKSNLVELALGFDPTHDGDTPPTTAVEDYVLTGMLTALDVLSPLPADVGVEDDYDLDGKNNLVELELDFDPTDGGDIPPSSAEADFVMTEMILLLGVADPQPADIAPTDDYDADGVDNQVELMAGSDPTVFSDLPTADAEYVAEELILLGVTDATLTGPSDDLDLDGFSNIAELLYLTNPTLMGSEPTITATDEFVAEEMAALGVFGVVAVDEANFAPDDDFDFDGTTNVVELLYGTDPTVNTGGAAVSAVNQFVASELALAGVHVVGASNVGRTQDYDSDGISNVVELLYGFDPNDDTDTPVLSALEVFVAEGMAEAGVHIVGASDIGPEDDYDSDTFSNVDELNQDSDPNDIADTP